MIRLAFCLVLFASSITSCNDTSNRTDNNKVDSTTITAVDTAISNRHIYKIEQQYLKRKRLLSTRLALYDIEKGGKDFELRLWLFPSMWDPSILYILKGRDSTWTLFHYQYYTLRATDANNYYENPLVDSVIMESVRPQKESWKTYIDKLQLDSLWNMQTESAIMGKEFHILDGHRYILEFNNKGKYKYLFYTTPEYFEDKDINHKKFTDFRKYLVDPIIYSGMRNP